VEAAKNGDEGSFAELLRRHERRVFRLASRFFLHREDVEEVAQETFLTVWRKLPTYRAEAPLEHWLTRICLNTCYARLRRKKPREEALNHDLPAPGSDPTAHLEVTRLLAHVGPRDRFLLQLMYGEGWSTEEIADKIGWSRSNVKVRAHRARKKLRRVLEREGER
jgi:RNA polymerase sigma-70 factor (ECF subfamily)